MCSHNAHVCGVPDNYLAFVREGDVIGLMSERGAMRGIYRPIISPINEIRNQVIWGY